MLCRNRLLRYGVIAQQSFNEKRNDRLLVTTLLSLPRFFRTSKSLLVAVIEKLFITLKETEGYCMPMSETKNLFPVDDRPKKSFRKISLTHMFRKIFETRVSNFRLTNT